MDRSTRPARRALLAVAVLAFAAIPGAEPAAPGRISEQLEAGLRAGRGDDRHLVWVYFHDKGSSAARASSVRIPLTPRALSRRSLRASGPPSATLDLPLDRGYVDAVSRAVIQVRQESRWFNAVSVEATAAQVRALEALPFVERLDVVRRYRRGPAEKVTALPVAARSSAASRPRALVLDYGTSLGQLQQIGVPAVHESGLHGEGVIVAVLDAGFSNLPHEVFAPMTILARRDFVNGDEDVGDGADQGEGSHGTETLSVLGGFKEGQLIGPAYAAGFILAKTENTASETPVEEDNWAAAAEWAEALGADVISTSLGYLEYDSPFTSYSFADMNGETAISTRAANLAASLGVVVVASAGNSGFDAAHNTLGAPADGRGVIAAGAVDARGTRAFFSSVGPTADGRIKPDVAAQGVSVKVASPTSPTGYGLADGTSFSCPLTAGVAALVLQAHPEYTPQQVGDALRATASQAGRPDNLLGYGIVNAAAAVGSRASTSQPGQWVPWDRHP